MLRPALVLVLLATLGAAAFDRVGRARIDAGLAGPCVTPIAWHIGDVDPRFGISADELAGLVEAAAGEWDAAAGRRLFRHEPGEGMPIRLVYDRRQEGYEDRVARATDLDTLEYELGRRRAEVGMLVRRLRRDQTEHDRGPTQATAAALGASVERYNRAIDRHNRAVERYNAAVEALQAGNGEETQAGNLVEERREWNGHVVSIDRTLTVALVGSRDELRRVLTHELGHALGLGHLPEPGAVMAASYEQRAASGQGATSGRAVSGRGATSGSPSLHPVDREAVGRLCAG